jgi:hypothetical protein
MDGCTRVQQSAVMQATNTTPETDRWLQTIVDAIVTLACPPAARTPASTAGLADGGSIGERQDVQAGRAADAQRGSALKDASISRLACLFRHWTWADEALVRFDRELAKGWEYEDDPLADRPFGAYYQWCALLCAFSEAALDQGLLQASELEALRPDLEASLPGLRSCREVLAAIPASLEEHPRVVDLIGDRETLERLRRVHHAFGAALRGEQMARELDWLLYEH